MYILQMLHMSSLNIWKWTIFNANIDEIYRLERCVSTRTVLRTGKVFRITTYIAAKPFAVYHSTANILTSPIPAKQYTGRSCCYLLPPRDGYKTILHILLKECSVHYIIGSYTIYPQVDYTQPWWLAIKKYIAQIKLWFTASKQNQEIASWPLRNNQCI